MAYLCALAPLVADPRCCGRHGRVATELKRAPVGSVIYRGQPPCPNAYPTQDKRRVLLACISTIGEWLCAFALCRDALPDPIRGIDYRMADSIALETGGAGRSTRPMLKRLLNIALPMIASHASETVMLFVDRLFLSRVGKLHFSAAMTGGLTSFTVASLFAGVTGYVNAIVAQYYGASREEDCANATVQSIYLSLMALP
ncbi:MAG: hypothetical protein KAU31_09680, partial [Spirochaetaceae bacterium]|nr:hypothetical protein [Spirochaetaceae bacterium]